MNETFTYANEEMGIPAILNPHEVAVAPEQRSIATYCAYYYDLYSIAPQVSSLFPLSIFVLNLPPFLSFLCFL